MHDLIDILFLREWWRYSTASAKSYDAIYHAFNLVEAAAWMVCAAIVQRRWASHHRGRVELAYAVAFVMFGATDVIEAQFVTSWLIWLKLANLITLLWLRRRVITRCYPQSRW